MILRYCSDDVDDDDGGAQEQFDSVADVDVDFEHANARVDLDVAQRRAIEADLYLDMSSVTLDSRDATQLAQSLPTDDAYGRLLVADELRAPTAALALALHRWLVARGVAASTPFRSSKCVLLCFVVFVVFLCVFCCVCVCKKN